MPLTYLWLQACSLLNRRFFRVCNESVIMSLFDRAALCGGRSA